MLQVHLAIWKVCLKLLETKSSEKVESWFADQRKLAERMAAHVMTRLRRASTPIKVSISKRQFWWLNWLRLLGIIQSVHIDAGWDSKEYEAEYELRIRFIKWSSFSSSFCEPNAIEHGWCSNMPAIIGGIGAGRKAFNGGVNSVRRFG